MDLDRARAENEIPVPVYLQVVDTVESNPDSAWIAPRADFKIVFEMFLVPSKHHIYAGIDAAPTDTAVEIIGCPEVATEEIGRFTRHAVERSE